MDYRTRQYLKAQRDRATRERLAREKELARDDIKTLRREGRASMREIIERMRQRA